MSSQEKKFFKRMSTADKLEEVIEWITNETGMNYRHKVRKE